MTHKKVWLITGARGGLSAAIAQAAAGHAVLATDGECEQCSVTSPHPQTRKCAKGDAQ